MNNLQTKLSQFEAAPPEAVWNKIEEALSVPQNYTQRLFAYEELPPAANWNKIETALAEETPAEVIPFTTRFRKPIRYVAAASIITVLLVTTTLLLKRTEAGAIEQGSEATVPVKKSKPITVKAEPVAPTNNTSQADVIAEAKNNTETTTSSFKKRIASLIKPVNVLSAVAINKSFAPTHAERMSVASFENDDYTIFTDDDGNAMRLSKKLYNLVSCPMGDGSCKERIQKLRQKLATNTSTTDFMGILEMLQQLQ